MSLTFTCFHAFSVSSHGKGHSVSAVLRLCVLFGHGSSVEMLDPRLGSRGGFGELILGAHVEVPLKISLDILQLFDSEVLHEAFGRAVEKRQHACEWGRMRGREGG